MVIILVIILTVYENQWGVHPLSRGKFCCYSKPLHAVLAACTPEMRYSWISNCKRIRGAFFWSIFSQVKQIQNKCPANSNEVIWPPCLCNFDFTHNFTPGPIFWPGVKGSYGQILSIFGLFWLSCFSALRGQNIYLFKIKSKYLSISWKWWGIKRNLLYQNKKNNQRAAQDHWATPRALWSYRGGGGRRKKVGLLME